MQKGVNKVIIVGNLGQDPEVRHMQNGGAVATLSIATSESWQDKATGERRERTEWHRTVLFGKLAEVAGEYLRKGSQVYIEGQLQTRKWQDQQTGQDKYTTEIVVQGYNGVMQILGSKQQQDWGQPAQQQPIQRQPVQQQPVQQQRFQQQQQAPQYNEPPLMSDDDIPF